jgi:hypothetical protein
MTPGRNDPCPCGSGKKYKKCHGAVIALQATQRACGTCTACCDGWVVGTIEGHEMKPGTPCHFRGEGCCTIYGRRPKEPCRNFVCGWLAPDSPFPESFRPDQLGVMIIRTRWREKPAFILCSAGRDPDEALMKVAELTPDVLEPAPEQTRLTEDRQTLVLELLVLEEGALVEIEGLAVVPEVKLEDGGRL